MSSTILIADIPGAHVEYYRDFLVDKGYKVVTATSLEDMVALFENMVFSMSFVSSSLIGDFESPLLRAIKKDHRECKFVLITHLFNAETFIRAMHCSVFHECLVEPLDLVLLENVVQNLSGPEKKNMSLVECYPEASNKILSNA